MAKFKFATWMDKQSENGKYIIDSGSPLLAKYAMKVDPKSGYEFLALTGEFDNIYDRIQADYPSTDINLLMERFALGETSALDIRQGFYADVSAMPKTYAELFQMNDDAIRYFEELPTDLKEMFNNSYTEFFSADQKEFDYKVAKYNERFNLSPEFDPKPAESEVSVDAE